MENDGIMNLITNSKEGTKTSPHPTTPVTQKKEKKRVERERNVGYQEELDEDGIGKRREIGDVGDVEDSRVNGERK